MYLHRIVIWHWPGFLPMEFNDPLYLMPVTWRAYRVALKPFLGLHRRRRDAGDRIYACSSIRTTPQTLFCLDVEPPAIF